MSNKPEVFDKNTLQETEEKLEGMLGNGSLDLPPEYSWSNALHSAWLQLQDTEDKDGNLAYKTCTKASVMKALLETIMEGLNPSKDQVYFIAYGKKLNMQRSNFGDEALLRRLYDVEDVYHQLIYEGDEIDYKMEDGNIKIEKHEQSLKDRLEGPVVAAYAVIQFEDGRQYTEIMGMDEIEKAWAQRRGSDKTKAHENFPGQMAKKTVISRACKRFINASDDSVVLSSQPDLDRERAHEKQVEAEKEEKANMETVDIESEPDKIPEPDEEPETEEEGVENEKPAGKGEKQKEAEAEGEGPNIPDWAEEAMGDKD